MWNSGSTPYTTSSGRVASRTLRRLLDVGEQVAVAEHRRPRRTGGTAREHHHREMIALDVDGRHRLRLAAARRAPPRPPAHRPRRRPRWRPSRDVAGGDLRPRTRRRRPDDHRRPASTSSISRSSSGAGLSGLSGTAIAPRPTIARYDDHEVRGCCAQMIATRSPSPTPRPASPPRNRVDLVAQIAVGRLPVAARSAPRDRRRGRRSCAPGSPGPLFPHDRTW